MLHVFSLLPDRPMTAWVIKSETDDPERALAIVEDQRAKGYTAWIEDERGKAVDEEALKIGKAELAKSTLYERGKGALVFAAAAVATTGTLYLGLWVNH